MSPSDDSPSLEELIGAVDAGDEDAVEELYKESYRELLWFTVSRLRALGCWSLAEHAEDINSTAWVRAWERFDKLNDPEKLRPWIRKIIERLALDHVFDPGGCIAEQRNRLPFEDAELESVFSQIIPADEVALSAERLEAVLNAAEGLNRILPDILLLRMEDLGFADIAQRLGGSPDNVRNIYYRGLRKLKIQFADEADPPGDGTELRGGHSDAVRQEEEDDFDDDFDEDGMDDADDSFDAVM